MFKTDLDHIHSQLLTVALQANLRTKRRPLMKTIIVATDYSAEATHATHYAAALARQTRARIVLFNSYQLPEHTAKNLLSTAAIDKQLAENRAYLESIAIKVAEQYGIKVDCWTNLTYVAEELDILVRRYDADLVVMGMWKKAWEDTLFGNTTTFVIRQAKYPVLVVPEGIRFRGINKILFSWDPDSLGAGNSLLLLRKLATRFHAQVQVLHIEQELELAVSSPKKRKARLEQILHDIPHTYRNLEEIDVADGIETGLRDYKADLLVMVPQKTGGLGSLFHESRTREMALRTQVPLLAIPNLE